MLSLRSIIMKFIKNFIIPFLIAFILFWIAFQIGKKMIERFSKRSNASLVFFREYVQVNGFV